MPSTMPSANVQVFGCLMTGLSTRCGARRPNERRACAIFIPPAGLAALEHRKEIELGTIAQLF